MTPEERARFREDIREILEHHYGSIENISYDDKRFILDAVRDSFYVKSRPALKPCPVAWEFSWDK